MYTVSFPTKQKTAQEGSVAISGVISFWETGDFFHLRRGDAATACCAALASAGTALLWYAKVAWRPKAANFQRGEALEEVVTWKQRMLGDVA